VLSPKRTEASVVHVLTLRNLPPSLKLSGVTFRMPITVGRRRQAQGFRPGIGTTGVSFPSGVTAAQECTIVSSAADNQVCIVGTG